MECHHGRDSRLTQECDSEMDDNDLANEYLDWQEKEASMVQIV